MRAAARFLVLAVLAGNAIAAEKWFEEYNRGVTAVNAKNYEAAATALQKAIAEMPAESTAARSGSKIITYVPHFWLGIAKFNLGDTDGALREWKICEEQGAIAQTMYYARMKDWVARAQTEKQREAEKAVSGPKKAAEAAISKAVGLQGSAMSAGGDRTNSYREAQRRLQDALAKFRGAGTDPGPYRSAQESAQQASDLFTAAAEEGAKLRAELAARPKPAPPKPPPVIVEIPFDDPPPGPTTTVTPEPVPVSTQARVAAEVAVQEYRRRISEAQREHRNGPQALRDFLRNETPEGEGLRDQLRGAKADADYDRIRATAEGRQAAMRQRIAEILVPPSVPAPAPGPAVAPGTVPPVPGPVRVDVTPAYRAFATGDLASAERLLTRILAATPAAEAFLLRGCVRYTQAMLSRAPEALLLSATADFKAALQRNKSLRLDPTVFSPKLVRRFEQVRSGG